MRWTISWTAIGSVADHSPGPVLSM